MSFKAGQTVVYVGTYYSDFVSKMGVVEWVDCANIGVDFSPMFGVDFSPIRPGIWICYKDELTEAEIQLELPLEYSDLVDVESLDEESI